MEIRPLLIGSRSLEAETCRQFKEGIIAFHQVSSERESGERTSCRLAKLNVRAKPLVDVSGSLHIGSSRVDQMLVMCTKGEELARTKPEI